MDGRQENKMKEAINEKSRNSRLVRFRKKHLNKYTFGKLAWSLFRTGLIIGISYVILYPLLVKLSVALMEKEDMYDMSVRWIPRHLTLENFRYAAHLMEYWEYLGTTAGVAAAATVLQVIFSSLSAYGLAKFQFRGRKALYLLVLLTMVIPPQTYITASYRQFRFFDVFGLGRLFGMEPISLVNTPWPLILLSVGCVAVKNGLFIFIMQQFFRNMPVEMDEAAYMDGAGPFRIFWRIILPNAVPALTTITVFSFVWNWNDLYTSSTYMPQMKMFPVALSDLNFVLMTKAGGASYVDPVEASQLTNAGVMIIQLPLLLFFLIAQKFFVEGVERTGLTGT